MLWETLFEENIRNLLEIREEDLDEQQIKNIVAKLMNDDELFDFIDARCLGYIKEELKEEE